MGHSNAYRVDLRWAPMVGCHVIVVLLALPHVARLGKARHDERRGTSRRTANMVEVKTVPDAWGLRELRNSAGLTGMRVVWAW